MNSEHKNTDATVNSQEFNRKPQMISNKAQIGSKHGSVHLKTIDHAIW